MKVRRVLSFMPSFPAASTTLAQAPLPVAETAQPRCLDYTKGIACPAPGAVFHGRDAPHDGSNPSIRDQPLFEERTNQLVEKP
ncbi:hypothetical protein [Accumulibacter sp.]|uniref:hypothetical protein n=1 Tax=Accumulibacter sp. TaxID=2053492 RepID=UPI001AC6A11E|nr:hypothetical protein [Accumulibacter sp.]MBN8515482.1 hypothetical protein [Accumulibacter sp.]MBO3703882.1 hypothetical protein [Accumulibacter sp.]